MISRNFFLLAIETSCDECSVAVLDYNGEIRSNIIYSQIKKHSLYGGVVPEIASREHLIKIIDVVKKSLKIAKISNKDIKAIAVTYGPGLIGSLLIGAQFARGLAQSLSVPIIGINHIEGHLMSGMSSIDFPKAPFIGLVASGGHSSIYEVDKFYNFKIIGDTRDDAAGEAFDKSAKLLGFNYPGGKMIDKYSKNGSNIYKFPIAFERENNLEYSFSGLKTSVRRKIEELSINNIEIKNEVLNNLCASIQKAIVDALLNKAFLACKKYNLNVLVFGGGVCSNSLLRNEAKIIALKNKVKIFLPDKQYCTDNAAMIGLAAYRRISNDDFNFSSFLVDSNASL